MIWMVQNNFEPVEGQGIHIVYELSKSQSMSRTASNYFTHFFQYFWHINPDT